MTRHPFRIENAFAVIPAVDPKPRLHRLYQDVYRTWLALPRAGERMDSLYALIRVMQWENSELSPEDDSQLRLAYEIKEAA